MYKLGVVDSDFLGLYTNSMLPWMAAIFVTGRGHAPFAASACDYRIQLYYWINFQQNQNENSTDGRIKHIS